MEKIVITKQTDNFFESYFRVLFADSTIKLTDTEYKILSLIAEYKKFDTKLFCDLLNIDKFSINNFKGKLKKKNLIIKKDNSFAINDKILPAVLFSTNKYKMIIEYEETKTERINSVDIGV